MYSHPKVDRISGISKKRSLDNPKTAQKSGSMIGKKTDPLE